MNYHSDTWIRDRIEEHYNESMKYFKDCSTVGIFLQGSQNYGMDYEDSDVDTKLIVTPTFKDIALNKKPVSTTHIRDNNEHTDWKDVRLYMQTFRKQNINFIEILFTPYRIVNPTYQEQWSRLMERREDIASYSPIQAVKSMRGVAKEKYFAMEHHYPSRMEWITKFGYDPKQLHHLLRIEDFITRYTKGEKYQQCLRPANADHLIEVKKGLYNLEKAREIADKSIRHIDEICEAFLDSTIKVNTEVEELLDDVSYQIMRISVENELRVK